MSYECTPSVGVAVIIHKDGQVLLGHRHNDPKKADSELQGEGTWTIPGGKLEHKEDIIDAAKREAKEECGIDVDNLRLVSVTNDIKGEKHFVTLVFVADSFSGEPQVLEPEEITEWKWYDINSLPQPMFFPAEKGIKNFLAGDLMKY